MQKISVIGQGYVGLTLAIGAANAGYEVIGVDVNAKLVEELSKGQTHVPGITKDEIKSLILSKKYKPTTNFDNISNSSIIVIAVPTPLNEDRSPNLEFLRDAGLEIVKYDWL
jgi:UDP-N-acetyl-D-glucosamine dehydrogenase